MKKILFGCYEVPGYGGASTSGYKIFKDLQQHGYNVAFVNIIGNQDQKFFADTFGENFGNPDNLPMVFNCFLENHLFKSHPNLSQILQKIAPDVMVGIGYIAAFLMKRALPERNLIFYTSGCSQVKQYLQKKNLDFLSLQKMMNTTTLPVLNQNEYKAVALADYIMFHSHSTRFLFEHFFEMFQGKMHTDIFWQAMWIRDSVLPYISYSKEFASREVDILFVASNWDRVEKNYSLVKKIADYFKDTIRIHVVGDVSEELPHVCHHGLISDLSKLYQLMANSKTVVSPSSFDAIPGILFEAATLGCNVVTSKNCGNWELCHESLLVSQYHWKEFVNKVEKSLEQSYPSDLGRFLASGIREDFAETILTLAHGEVV